MASLCPLKPVESCSVLSELAISGQPLRKQHLLKLAVFLGNLVGATGIEPVTPPV